MNPKLLGATSLERAKSILFIVFLLSNINLALAQGPGCPGVDAGDDVTIDCSNGSGCADLNASFLEIGETSQYNVASIDYDPPFPFTGLSNPISVGEDDVWSSVINLPFDFCFFEGTYDEVVIGSNGIISFDVSQAEGFCEFTLGETELIPTTEYHQNAIMLYHDMDPRFGNAEIGYEILGDSPCRVLVVSYAEVPYYNGGGPSNELSTFQMVLYETTNAIEFYVQNKPDPGNSIPTPINGGRAVLGIQNSTGTVGFTPPNRNTSVWSATDEAWRFTPSGTPAFDFEWVDSNGAVVATTPMIEVCPTEDETYTAIVTYTNCNGDIIEVEDDVEVIVESSAIFTVDLGGDQAFCDVPSYDITAALDGADPADATFLWSTGETTQTITVTTSDIYSVDVTVDGCTITESVDILFLTSPDCTIVSDCGGTDFEENFGTGTGRECDLGGATTTYSCNATAQIEDGEYVLTNDSTGLNFGWHVGMEDHTPDDVDGRALYVNADFTPGEFYRRTISLSANTDYSFSAWITTVYDTDTGICPGGGNPSNVIFRIEDTGGALIQETNTGDIANGPEPDWQQFFIDFNTGSNTDIQLVLINNSIGGCGNDLAIDDINLSIVGTEPVLVTPPDILECEIGGTGTASFDLTTQIPTILDGQDPALFNISFHLTQLEAEANVNAISDPTTYENTTSPETIYVRVERADDTDCFSTVDFDLIVELIEDLQIDLETNVAICEGDDFPILDATPQNSNIDLSLVTYEWVDGSGAVVATTATFTPTVSDNYTVTVTYPPCTEEIITVAFEITEPPVLDLGEDITVCEGDSVALVPTITGNTQGISYLWSTGETTETITVNTSGTYTLEVTVGACVVSDSINVAIDQFPEVSIDADFKVCPEEENTVTAVASGGDNLTYQWFLNGAVIEGATESTYTFTLPANTVGEQLFTVVVLSGQCATEAEVGVRLYDVDNCTISQGLSPNGDGKNDCLDLEFIADRTEGISLEVFNRYGMSMFEQNNYINEFCGVDKNGNELPTGNYFYVIKFNSPDPIFGDLQTGYIYINKEEN